MEAKYFNARWDTLLKWCTISVFLFLGIMLRVSFLPQFASAWPTALVRTAILALLAVAFFLAPKYYVIVKDSLIIKRYAGHIIIPLSEIVSVRALDVGEMRFAIRSFGVGGFFGYYGRFWCRNLGSFKAYITDRSNCVVIQTRSGQKIVISPENRQEFLEIINALT